MTRMTRGTNQTRKQGNGNNKFDADWARAFNTIRDCGCNDCKSWRLKAGGMKDIRLKRRHYKRFPHPA